MITTERLHSWNCANLDQTHIMQCWLCQVKSTTNMISCTTQPTNTPSAFHDHPHLSVMHSSLLRQLTESSCENIQVDQYIQQPPFTTHTFQLVIFVLSEDYSILHKQSAIARSLFECVIQHLSKMIVSADQRNIMDDRLQRQKDQC